MLKIFIPVIMFMYLNSPWHIICLSISLMILSLMPNLYFYSILSSCINNIMTIDPMSIILMFLSLWVTLLMFLASFSVIFMNKTSPLFNMLMSSLLLILIFAFSTNSMIMFYMMFEASLIPTMLMILGWGYQPERLQASLFLMMYTVTASLPLLAFITLYYTKNYSLFFTLPINNSMNISLPLSMMMSLAFLVKMPMYLSHLWLPKAHVEAPVAGSMILAGVLLKLGAYGIMRMGVLFPTFMNPIFNMIFSISLWGAMITAIICLRQHDMKSLIAYSSVSHMALVILGMLSMFKWGWEGAFLMLFAHGVASSGLFSLANMTYESSNTRSIFLTKGLLSLSPIMSVWWFLLSIANMGAPPSLNLLSEIILLSSIISSSLWSSFFILMSMFLAAGYSLTLYSSTHHGSLSNYSMTFSSSLSRNSLTSLAHILPLFFMFMNPIILTSSLL